MSITRLPPPWVPAEGPILRPTGPGVYTEWTEQWGDPMAHWQSVLDPADGNAVFCNGWGSQVRDLYTVQPTTVSTIRGIDLHVVTQQAGLVASAYRHLLRAGGQDFQGPVINLPLGDPRRERVSRWAVNPATGNPWTTADVATLQAGMQFWNYPLGGGCAVFGVWVVVLVPPS